MEVGKLAETKAKGKEILAIGFPRRRRRGRVGEVCTQTILSIFLR